MAQRSAARQPRIWMNVTTSANWTRPPVGIVRVEQEVCRELGALYGDRFETCVFKDGKFETTKAKPARAVVDMIWPDPSFDFPALTSLEVAPPPHRPTIVEPEPVEASGPIFAYGDVLISIGLDWDQGGLAQAFYELKSKLGVHVVCCCYDLIPILFPQYCVGDVSAHFKQYFTNISWAASLMLCISKQTERDYLQLAHDIALPKVPTTVIPLGNNMPEEGDLVADAVSELVRKPYILFVSTIERRKNHEVLYRAYHLLCRAGHADILPKLVFVGMAGWGVGDFMKDLELDPLTRDHIVQLNHVNDAELRLLYEKCTLFAYPSLYEGWGLPVAEVLAFGRPVLASDRGSIPEVGGDLVEYVDPWSASDWAERILHAVRNPKWIADRAARIRKEYKPRAWSQTAKVIKDAIDRLPDNRRRSVTVEPGYDMSTMGGLHYGARLLSQDDCWILGHGPYIGLPAGRISVVIFVDLLKGKPCKAKFSLQHAAGTKVLTQKELRFDGTQKLGEKIEFNFDLAEDIADFEVIVDPGPNLKISINQIVINNNLVGDVK